MHDLVSVDVFERKDDLARDSSRAVERQPNATPLGEHRLERGPGDVLEHRERQVDGVAVRPEREALRDVVEEANDVRVGARGLAQHAEHLRLPLETREGLASSRRRAARP